jgi:elongation factor G
LGELAAYPSRLNAQTAGRGCDTLSLSHYEAVTPAAQQQLASAHHVRDN